MFLPDRKIRHLAFTSLASVLLLALAACTTPTPAGVTSVTITGGDREVGIDETAQLTAAVMVQGETDKNVTWASSDEGVATVSEDGELTALAIGSSTVTATSVSDASKLDAIEITVTATCRSPNRLIEIPDVALRTAILEASGKADGPVLCEDMRGLTSLTTTEKGIQDLSGSQHATNLTHLDLSKNDIDDIAPLANLGALTSLNLASNEISTIAPLANLTNLTSLQLGNNGISDVAPLEYLTKLRSLYLGWNEIGAIAPLANLTNVRDLDLTDNNIRDIAPLENHTNLNNLYLGQNCLDVSDDSRARNLIATLEANGTNVSYASQKDCGP